MAETTRTAQKCELCRLAVAASDILQAFRLAELLIDRVRDLADPLYAPLFHATVAAYGRPFSGNRPFGRLDGPWTQFKNETLQRTHDQLLQLRNQVVAHSDAADLRVEIYPPGVVEPLTATRVTAPSVCVSTALLEISEFPRVRDTCADLGRRIDMARDTLVDALYAARVLPATPFRVTLDEGL